MFLANELQAIDSLACPSPLRGYEHVRGFGIFAAPFESGHVLALRVFPANDFAPYKAIWHRAPDGDWSIFVDAPRHDIACPRYFGAAASLVQSARISLTWTGPAALRIEMDAPRLTWEIAMTTSSILRLMNVVNPRLPEGVRRARSVLRAMEYLAGAMLGIGRVTLAGITPNGQFSLLLPERMFYLASGHAELDGEDLGPLATGGENPAIGTFRLPARPVFAVGRGYFEILDPAEYQRTIRELGERTASRATAGVAAGPTARRDPVEAPAT